MYSKRLWTLLTLLAVLAVSLAACTVPAAAPTSSAGPETTAPAEGPQGTLTIALTTDIAAIESPYAPERQADNASWTLYDGLVFPETDGTYSPALAESWEVSEDGTTYTFHLRQGVTFHNGEAFTADAVVYSWQVYSQPEVTYANEWNFATAVEKVDDYTVAISTAAPNALMLAQVAGWTMIPPLAHAEMGLAAFAQSPIGTGPFMFKEWIKGDHLTVVANPNYWREGYPKVAEVVFRFMPESATRVAAIQAGEIDIAPRLTADEADLLTGDDLTVIDYPVDRVYYIAFNNMTTGLDTPIMDVKVRQAIAHAIDVQTIIDSIFSGAASRAVSLMTQNNLGYVDTEPLAYDVEQAKTLLAEAGYADGFTIGMACPEAAYANINEVCQAIQGYLTEVGITVDLELIEANAFWTREENKELPPLFVDSWSNTLNEAYGRLQGAVGKDQAYANWSDEKFHTLLDQIIATPDVAARAALYSELQTYMSETQPFVFLYSPQAFEGVNQRVQNYQPRGAEDYFLWNVSVTGE
ncbi:MAG: ABC transporter substrate-binding protein [Caldilineaceae bacterium]|nr:ABC transporter substrate-binding protein [Caldilineaceae bacterium]